MFAPETVAEKFFVVHGGEAFSKGFYRVWCLLDHVKIVAFDVKMKKAHWTRVEKWTAAGTIAVIISLVLIVFVPEIRTKLGLERHLPPSPKTVAKQSTKTRSQARTMWPEITSRAMETRSAMETK